MSSYRPLAEHLANRKDDVWDAKFVEIQYILGRSLPRSAFAHPAWWANQTGAGHSQAEAWRSVGWRTSKLDLERRRVRFERDHDAPAVQSPSPEDSPRAREEALLAQARLVSGIEDRQMLIENALRRFIDSEAARHLIAMGGTAPDFTLPPRERPES